MLFPTLPTKSDIKEFFQGSLSTHISRTAFPLGVASLFFTQTRAAWGAFVIATSTGLLFYALLFTKLKTRRIIIGLLVSALIVGIGLSVFLFSLPYEYKVGTDALSRVLRIFSIEAWLSRFAGWLPAIDSIIKSPWIGYGLGSSYNLYFLFSHPDVRLMSREHSYNHVHNELIEFTQEAGLIGLVIYLITWVILFYFLLKLILNSEKEIKYRVFAIALFSAMIGFLFHGFFSVAPRMIVTRLPAYTLIGLITTITVLSKTDEKSTRLLKTPKAAIITAIALASILISWLFYTNWALKQAKFVKLINAPYNIHLTEKLEEYSKNYTDVYALDYLSNLQMLF